jgi:WD40 repeat protein
MGGPSSSIGQIVPIGVVKGDLVRLYAATGVRRGKLAIVERRSASVLPLSNLGVGGVAIREMSSAKDPRFSSCGQMVAWAERNEYQMAGRVCFLDTGKTASFVADKRPDLWSPLLPGFSGSEVVAFHPDGTIATLAGPWDGKLWFVDVNGSEAGSARPPNCLTVRRKFHTKALAWSPDGKVLAACGSWTNTKLGVETSSSEAMLLYGIDHEAQPIKAELLASLDYPCNPGSDASLAMAFSPDSRLLALGNDIKADATIKLFDTARTQLIAQAPAGSASTNCLEFSANGEYLFAGADDGALQVWRVEATEGGASLTPTGSWPFTGSIASIAVSASERAVVVAAGTSKKHEWAISTLTVPFDLGVSPTPRKRVPAAVLRAEAVAQEAAQPGMSLLTVTWRGAHAISDPPVQVWLDGKVVGQGSFVHGFEIDHAIPEGGHAAWSTAGMRRSPICNFAIRAGCGYRIELEYSRAWGNFKLVGAETPGSSQPAPAFPASQTDAATTAPIVLPAAWQPTHAVPATGMTAWASPGQSAGPSMSLSPGLELMLVHASGDWALVGAANGWTGWVDGRHLVPKPAS